MLNSLTLRQQHFLCQRKNLYNQEPSRSSSGETDAEVNHENLCLEFLFSLISPYFIWGSVVTFGRMTKAGTARSVI